MRLFSILCSSFMALLPGLPSASAESGTDLPDTCYLFAHFYYNGDTGMHLAWSKDGLEWEILNDGKGYIIPEIGESSLMRDPSIVRGPDGIFHMVWTTAWSGKTIGHASSPDLINWSEQLEIPVMEHEPRARNCWAPEVQYIPEEDLYLILWSTTILGKFPETALSNRRSPRNHRIYYTTTRDFKEFTPTALYYDGGFNVIDAAITPVGNGEWLMFVKHEEFSPVTQKNIRMIRAKTWRGPFSAPTKPVSGDYWAEGPSPMRIDGMLHVYFDKHDIGQYGVVRSPDFENWEDLSGLTSFPLDTRHGTFFAVPRDVMVNLIGDQRGSPKE